MLSSNKKTLNLTSKLSWPLSLFSLAKKIESETTLPFKSLNFSIEMYSAVKPLSHEWMKNKEMIIKKKYNLFTFQKYNNSRIHTQIKSFLNSYFE